MHAEQYASEAVSYLVANAMDHKTENYHLEAACGKSKSIWKLRFENFFQYLLLNELGIAATKLFKSWAEWDTCLSKDRAYK